MEKKKSCKSALAATILFFIALTLVMAFPGCASSAGAPGYKSSNSSIGSQGSNSGNSNNRNNTRTNNGSNGTASAEVEKQKPVLIVKSPQNAEYNGGRLPISFSYTGEDFPEVIYFPSQRAMEEERGGSYSAPSLVGTYYVLVRCLYEEVYVEYRILRSPVRIKAAAIQEAVFNGNPKRVVAEADPPVPLSYSYYPNRELRTAAIRAEAEAAQNRNNSQSPTDIYKGYRRIESAPTDQGTYYVWIYFPGDENHLPAQANVEFTILPAPAAAPRR